MSNEGATYLGVSNDGIEEKYTWIWSKTLAARVAVSSAVMAEYEEGVRAHNTDPETHDRPSEPSPAVFSAVVRIDEDCPYLRSDSGWRPGGYSTFAKSKQSFIGRRTQYDLFRDDYSYTMDNLIALYQKDCKRELKKSKGVFVPQGEDAEGLKFRNTLFTRVGERKESDKLTKNNPEAPLTIDYWPTHSDDCTRELEILKANYVVNHLRAYNISGNLIFPTEYRKELEGATCAIYFTLKHWSYNDDSIAADVTSISVLQAAYRRGPTPSPKRAISLKDPFSPKKRTKRDDINHEESKPDE
ncbi:hypothetical protein EW026_g3140 [Hermanssonia centrifuga]|uniref:Uncharacterized protein n=1 Tax=Hermanssonia centrifuga TaxID=98765 RepID=A0A4S4KM44_9APHY|nr:hypothetical protein EW026_g3140 [Hermanssonia centrifuga]